MKSKKPNPYAVEALRAAVSIACLAGFGRLDPKTNALDDKIDDAASRVIDLLCKCLPPATAKRIIQETSAAGIRRDALDCGLSKREANELADSPPVRAIGSRIAALQRKRSRKHAHQ